MKALTARSSFHLPSPWLEAEPGEHTGEGQRKGRKTPRKKGEKDFAWLVPAAKRGESANPDQSLLCSFHPT